MRYATEQDRLKEIADRLAKANFDGFVPPVVVECYAIAYYGLTDKRGFVEPRKELRDAHE